MLTYAKFRNTAREWRETDEPMPVLFVGHGSPMNAIEDNAFSRGWQQTGRQLPRPKAILCVSAHWETRGTFVTAMEKPPTIHDFGGFPPELHAVQYPAPGSPAWAKETATLVQQTPVGLDYAWGLDHGCWSVVKHLFPDADIPVLQLSIDRTRPAAWHYALARDLSALRRRGVLIIGSGNMVHNLGILDWNSPDKGYDWAEEANSIFKTRIAEGDHTSLIEYQKLGKAVQLSVPTTDHYFPLLYILGLQDKNEPVAFFNDHTTMGSISMTSVKIG